jgi:predicted transcriptional regulator YheO
MVKLISPSLLNRHSGKYVIFRFSSERGAHLMAEPIESEVFLLAQVEQIAHGIIQTFGEGFCEVLIHDFRQPEHSIVWIRGQLTRRHLGGAMSEVGLEMMAQGDEAQAKINYVIQTDDGKFLKASMIPLRNMEGHVFGALCIKVDITHLLVLEQHLCSMLTTDDNSSSIKHVHYSDSIGDVAQSMIDEAMKQLGMALPPKDTRGRILLIQALRQRGFFSIRRAISVLAELLQVSRASIYNHLKELQPDENQAQRDEPE